MSSESSTTGLASPGSVIATKYRVQRLLGEGGMGRVYEVRHEMPTHP